MPKRKVPLVLAKDSPTGKPIWAYSTKNPSRPCCGYGQRDEKHPKGAKAGCQRVQLNDTGRCGWKGHGNPNVGRPIGLKNGELSNRQEMFAQVVPIPGIGLDDAAVIAGYPAATAASTARKLIKVPKVQEKIQEVKAKMIERSDITADRVMVELARIGFLDIRRAYDLSGNLLPVTELDDDVAAAIAGIDVSEIFEGIGADRAKVGELKKLRFASKNEALKMLGNALELFKEKVEHSGSITDGLSPEERESKIQAIMDRIAARSK